MCKVQVIGGLTLLYYQVLMVCLALVIDIIVTLIRVLQNLKV